MPKRTNPFQKLTVTIMALFHEPDYVVTESVLARDKDTGQPREIDILVRHRTDPARSFMVECRDYRRKQNVQWIEELDGRARSFDVRRIVAVSSSGFSRSALTKAQARGIDTMWLREAEEAEWRQWNTGLPLLGLNIGEEHHDVPLEHYDVDGRRVQTGRAPFLGRDARVAIDLNPGGMSKVLLDNVERPLDLSGATLDVTYSAPVKEPGQDNRRTRRARRD